MKTLIAIGPAHAAVAAAIHTACFEAGWTVEPMRQVLAMPGVLGWLAVAGEAPQGLILCRRAVDEAEVITLATLPEARRQGVAGRLLDLALATLAQQAARRLFLEVAAADGAALALYHGRGFAPVGRRRDYYGPGRDALVLRRDLCPDR